MPNTIASLNRLQQAMSNIDKQHVGLSDQGQLKADSGSWLGRVVNNIKSLGGNDNTKAIMNHVVQTIRDTEGLGDRFADIAAGRLGSALSRGKPISGRKVSQIISDIINIKETEDKALAANIRLNTKDLCESQDFTGLVWKTVNEKIQEYGLQDSLQLTDQDMGKLQEKIQSSLERNSLNQKSSPTLKNAAPVITEACRMFALNRIKENIAGHVEKFAGHEQSFQPLMDLVRQSAQQRNLQLDITPKNLEKLVKKFEDKLNNDCLMDKTNMHPPQSDNSETMLGGVVKNFLDTLQMIDKRTDISPALKAEAQKAVISSPALYSQSMVTALCDILDASTDMATTLQNPSLTPQQLEEGIKTYNQICNETMHSDLEKGILKDGFKGADETEQVRGDAAKIGVTLTTKAGRGAKTAFEQMVALNSPLTALRYDLEQADFMDRDTLMSQLTLIRFLGETGERGGLNVNFLEDPVGPGCVPLDHLRTKQGLEKGVHAMGGIKVGKEFNTDTFKNYFEKSIKQDMSSSKLGMANAQSETLTAKTKNFTRQFLVDFFRNGIVINGKMTGRTGTNDIKAMEEAMDELIGQFPSEEEAAYVTGGLHQSLGLGFMAVFEGDPATREAMNNLMMSTGRKLNDRLEISITSRKLDNGTNAYDVKTEYGLQKDKDSGNSSGHLTEALSLTTRMDLTIKANQGSGQPEVTINDFDFLFGKMESR